MRTEPKKHTFASTELVAKNKQMMEVIGRKVAILFVLAVVVLFFFNMLLP